MKPILVIFLLISHTISYSQERDCEETKTPKIMEAVIKSTKGCPDESKLEMLCYAVGDRTKLENPIGKIRFTYQKKFLEAACVDTESDSQEIIQSKVSAMWLKFRDKLVCNSVSFDVENGSILKFAVAHKSDEFIYDMLKWKLDLNKVDADNRTVLDYTKRQIERNKGNSLEPKLQSYYNRMRAAGAKHKSEL